jgi:hypothetical protein
MRTFPLAIAAILLVSSLALAEESLSILTTSGQRITGKVISETSRGYLIRTASGTQLVEYSTVVEVQKIADSGAAPAPVAPMTPAQLSPPPPPPSTDVEPTYQPMTPPQNSDQFVRSEQFEPADQKPKPDANSRKGFHLGIGFNLGVAPYINYAGSGFGQFFYVAIGPQAAGEFHFDWTFGIAGLRLSPSLAAIAGGSGVGIGPLLHVQFHLNLGSVFTLGGGLQGGVYLGSLNGGIIGPTLSPMILKLGDRGQHQIELRFSIQSISNYYQWYIPKVTLGYNFLF